VIITELNNISLSGIKGILFDLDNTLYEYDVCHKAAFNSCRSLAEDKYKIKNDVFELNWKVGRDRVHKDLHGQGASHSRLLYFQKLYENAFRKTHPVFALEMEEEYWSVFLNTMKFASGVEDFLKLVKSHGLKTCIVTDLTAQIQMRKWKKLELGRYMDYLVSSEEAGIEKPSPLIFKLALEKINLSAGEVIMIGDNFEKDIKGLDLMGINAYLVSAERTPKS